MAANITPSEKTRVQTRVALAFPDIYDLGVPNLGLAIFYDQLNRDPEIWAERVYAPWIDMEAEMRARGIPLYTLESKTPIADAAPYPRPIRPALYAAHPITIGI